MPKYLIWFSILAIFSSLAVSKEYLPKGCQSIALEGTDIHLKAHADHLLFLHNVSESEIWLGNRESAKLTLDMHPGGWSVLFIPSADANWRCVESQTGHEQQVPCQSVIALCQWPATAPKNVQFKNSLWLVENQSIVVAKAYLQRMGWLFDKVGTKLSKQEVKK